MMINSISEKEKNEGKTSDIALKGANKYAYAVKKPCAFRHTASTVVRYLEKLTGKAKFFFAGKCFVKFQVETTVEVDGRFEFSGIASDSCMN